jgi:hypothetical protein
MIGFRQHPLDLLAYSASPAGGAIGLACRRAV